MQKTNSKGEAFDCIPTLGKVGLKGHYTPFALYYYISSIMLDNNTISIILVVLTEDL